MAGSAGKIKPGLERISLLLKYLGNPQEHYPSIRIAGTNGKGSTAHFLNNILVHSGVSTGLYTSPHICEPEERIRTSHMFYEGNLFLDARRLEKRFLSSFSKRIKDRPTFFELTTAIAFDYFREKNIDFAVLETGLGGRLDATAIAGNIGEILTDVSIDHTEFLGNTVEEILLEKIGALKGAFLISCSLPQYLGYLVKIGCEKRKSQLSLLGRDFFFEKVKDGTFNFTARNVTVTGLLKTAPGDFQYRNAALAVAAALKIHDYYRIDKKELLTGIRKGIEATHIPGRYQIVSEDPIVILDVGHNYLSSKTLRRELMGMRENGMRRVSCVFTMMRNRNPVLFLKTLKRVSDLFIFFPCGDRFLRKRDIDILKLKQIVPLEIAEDFTSAYKAALDFSGRDGLVLLTGSFVTAENYYTLTGSHEKPVQNR